jgi:hypothetical protein
LIGCGKRVSVWSLLWLFCDAIQERCRLPIKRDISATTLIVFVSGSSHFEQHRQVKAEGSDIAMEAVGFFVNSECFFGTHKKSPAYVSPTSTRAF